MARTPFEKFIITLLFFNQDIRAISERLTGFSYSVKDEEIADIFKSVKDILPVSIKEILSARALVDPANQDHAAWLRNFGVFEFYNYVVNKDRPVDDAPPYFKWCEDCLWIHTYKDVMVLTNIFLYNDEPLDSISDIIMFKFRKKIGVDALELYRRMFWQTEGLTAKDAYRYCKPFRDNSVIVRTLRSGETEIESVRGEEQDNGSDVPFTFHDTEYIKWKIGYQKVKVPDPKTFLETVKRDSMFKYYETMAMAKSVTYEEEESSGSNEKLGTFDSTLKRTKYHNVEEQRAALSQKWIKLYMEAEKSTPTGAGDAATEFLKQMRQLSLEFKDTEKVVAADQVPGLFDDIKGDMQ